MASLRLLSLFLAVAVVCGHEGKDIDFDNLTVRVGDGRVKLYSKAGALMSELYASGYDLGKPYTACPTESEQDFCMEWTNEKHAKFTLKIEKDIPDCYVATANGEDPKGSVGVYFPYNGSEWYGGPERYTQLWPVQTLKMDAYEPYTTRSENNQGVLEPYWFSSSGESLFVSQNTTLFFASNLEGYEGSLVIQSKNEPPYKLRDSVFLQYHYCYHDNPVDAHNHALQYFLNGKPTKHPGVHMMTYPTYSTWAKYYSDINQEKVLDFTNQILDHGYLMGTIEIDDKWDTCYGSFEVDTNKFPNIKNLTDYIHSKGGKVTAWVHPFINTDCELYQQALNEGRLVLDGSGNAASSWWNGAGGVVDITNTTTKNWWVQRLKNTLESSGMDGYKFDAGESGWLPQLPEITGDPLIYPDSFVRNFVEAAAEFGSDIEVRVGRQTQDVPLFVRMLDKDSKWGLDNGLQSLITTAFQMGLNGYPFILPDMIGGNGYGGQPPSKELFIRWVQANALLPAMQFSLLPWDIDDETSEITKKYLDLHTSYSEELLRASNLTLTDGRPIIAPIWWYAPTDNQTYAISDEYMLGDRVLVAPVVTEGAVTRNIYLPEGTWSDSNQKNITGPVWLSDYPAPLDFLPIFTKVA